MTTSAKPMFPDATPSAIAFAWAGIVGNGIVLAGAIGALVTTRGHVAVSWYHVVIVLIAGLFLLDLFSGLVHWFSDTWLDEHTPGFERTFAISREHHIQPQNITAYCARDLVAYSCWPAFVVLGPVVLALGLRAPTLAVYLGHMLCAIVCLGMFVGSHCHALAHRCTSSRTIRVLRWLHLLISPAYHRVHHSGRHDIRYAVINGWSNPVCDRIRLWRGLEQGIQAVTGAVPRRSDLAWRATAARACPPGPSAASPLRATQRGQCSSRC